MICKGLFDVERMRGEITETEQFDGSVYVTVHLDGGDVSRMRMVPMERDHGIIGFYQKYAAASQW